MQFSITKITSLLLASALAVSAHPAATKRDDGVTCGSGPPSISGDTFNTIVRTFKQYAGENVQYPAGISGGCCSGYCMVITGENSGFVSSGALESGIASLGNTCVPAGSAGGTVPITG
jgi:hypothetical protein